MAIIQPLTRAELVLAAICGVVGGLIGAVETGWGIWLAGGGHGVVAFFLAIASPLWLVKSEWIIGVVPFWWGATSALAVLSRRTRPRRFLIGMLSAQYAVATYQLCFTEWDHLKRILPDNLALMAHSIGLYLVAQTFILAMLARGFRNPPPLQATFSLRRLLTGVTIFATIMAANYWFGTFRIMHFGFDTFFEW